MPDKWKLFVAATIVIAATPGPNMLFVQFSVLVSLFAVIEVSCYFAYATGGRQVSAWLEKPRFRKIFDRFAGTLFVGFALALIFGR